MPVVYLSSTCNLHFYSCNIHIVSLCSIHVSNYSLAVYLQYTCSIPAVYLQYNFNLPLLVDNKC